MTTETPELTGKVVNGVIVLDQPGRLEDGTVVRVKPVMNRSKPQKATTPLAEMLLSFAGTVDGLPEDMALNHDHYLCVPKRTR